MNSVTWLLVFLEDLILASTAVFCPVDFGSVSKPSLSGSNAFPSFHVCGVGRRLCVYGFFFFFQFKCVFYSFDSVSSISINCYNYTQ